MAPACTASPIITHVDELLQLLDMVTLRLVCVAETILYSDAPQRRTLPLSVILVKPPRAVAVEHASVGSSIPTAPMRKSLALEVEIVTECELPVPVLDAGIAAFESKGEAVFAPETPKAFIIT